MLCRLAPIALLAGAQGNGDLAVELASKVAALEEAEKRVAKLQGQLAIGKQKFSEQVAKVKELKAALAAAQQQQVSCRGWPP
jgi:hypothetical protein